MLLLLLAGGAEMAGKTGWRNNNNKTHTRVDGMARSRNGGTDRTWRVRFGFWKGVGG